MRKFFLPLFFFAAGISCGIFLQQWLHPTSRIEIVNHLDKVKGNDGAVIIQQGGREVVPLNSPTVVDTVESKKKKWFRLRRRD